MATGERPFQGDTTISVISSIVKDTPRSVTDVNPAMPRDLGRIVRRALVKDPDHRYQTVRDLGNDLEDLKRDVDSGDVLSSSASRDALRIARRPPRALAGVAALVIGALAVAGAWRFLNRDRASPRPAVGGGRLTLLLSSEGEARSPALSADGKMIAYIASDGDAVNLYVRRVAGGERIRLTDDAAFKDDPSFSPDGDRIAFARRRPAPARPEICVIPTLGGRAIPVIADGRTPVWSPDGNHLAFIQVRRGEPEALAVAAVDGSEMRILLKADAVNPFFNRLVWSPDGSLVAFSRSGGGVAQEIWLMPSAGGQARRLWQDPPGVVSADPVFTPDGRGIVHTSSRGGATNLWVMPMDGTGPVVFTSRVQALINSRASRAPARLRFKNSRTAGHAARPSIRRGNDANSGHAPFLNISPDGRWLAFARTEGGTTRVYISPVAGGEARRLTESSSTTPRWSPDGEWIAYSVDRSFFGGIWLIKADGTELHRVTQTGGWPVWWPDGKQIGYQMVTSEGNTQIVVTPLDGGQTRTLDALRFYGSNFPFDISRDGRQLVVTNSQHLSDEIWLLESAQDSKR